MIDLSSYFLVALLPVFALQQANTVNFVVIYIYWWFYVNYIYISLNFVVLV